MLCLLIPGHQDPPLKMMEPEARSLSENKANVLTARPSRPAGGVRRADGVDQRPRHGFLRPGEDSRQEWFRNGHTAQQTSVQGGVRVEFVV